MPASLQNFQGDVCIEKADVEEIVQSDIQNEYK
jgi:hypothetical protein